LLRPLPRSTLFPYTTLFRSVIGLVVVSQEMQRAVDEKELERRARLGGVRRAHDQVAELPGDAVGQRVARIERERQDVRRLLAASDRKSTRLNSSHDQISYAV